MISRVALGLIVTALIFYVLFLMGEVSTLQYYLAMLTDANVTLQADALALQQYIYQLQHKAM